MPVEESPVLDPLSLKRGQPGSAAPAGAPATVQLPFSEEQERWYTDACARLNPERLQRLLLQLIDIPSPTGGERRASEFIADYLGQQLRGRARYQPVNEDTGNAIG